MTFVRAYLRASTAEQDARRARAELARFALERNLVVASWYAENESGASLHRPELLRLIADSQVGDILLVEQIDRLSRLNASDWEALKASLAAKRLRVVSLDLPTSWQGATLNVDDATAGILDAVNRMLLDVLAVVARKDYLDRRRRQEQGIERAKAEGRYLGRRANAERHAVIASLIEKGMSWSQVSAATGASRSTISRAITGGKPLIEIADLGPANRGSK